MTKSKCKTIFKFCNFKIGLGGFSFEINNKQIIYREYAKNNELTNKIELKIKNDTIKKIDYIIDEYAYTLNNGNSTSGNIKIKISNKEFSGECINDAVLYIISLIVHILKEENIYMSLNEIKFDRRF